MLRACSSPPFRRRRSSRPSECGTGRDRVPYGLPPGGFPFSIFDTVLNGLTVRGSIVGTRLDLQEALNFAAEGKVTATIETASLDNINAIFDRMKQGDIRGRVVLDFREVRTAD